jgi:hypothetical protein
VGLFKSFVWIFTSRNGLGTGVSVASGDLAPSFGPSSIGLLWTMVSTVLVYQGICCQVGVKACIRSGSVFLRAQSVAKPGGIGEWSDTTTLVGASCMRPETCIVQKNRMNASQRQPSSHFSFE